MKTTLALLACALGASVTAAQTPRPAYTYTPAVGALQKSRCCPPFLGGGGGGFGPQVNPLPVPVPQPVPVPLPGPVPGDGQIAQLILLGQLMQGQSEILLQLGRIEGRERLGVGGCPCPPFGPGIQQPIAPPPLIVPRPPLVIQPRPPIVYDPPFGPVQPIEPPPFGPMQPMVPPIGPMPPIAGPGINPYASPFGSPFGPMAANPGPPAAQGQAYTLIRRTR
jgi:hypothetical protein